MRKTLVFRFIFAISLVTLFILPDPSFAKNEVFASKNQEMVAKNNNGIVYGYGDTLKGFTMSVWAEREVKKSVAMNIFYRGLNKDLKQYINREDFAAISVLTLEAKYSLANNYDIKSTFLDINRNSDTYDYINKAKQYKIVEGLSETEFAPYRDIKRKEALVMLYRIYKNYEKTKFPISNSSRVIEFKNSKAYKNLEDWAKDAVVYFIDAGIFRGYGNGEYGLNDKISNEQALVLATRYVDYLRDLSGEIALAGNKDLDELEPKDSSQDGSILYKNVRFSESEYKDMQAYLDFVKKHPIKNELKVYSVNPTKGGANGKVGVLNNSTQSDFINVINRFRMAAKVPLVQIDDGLMKKAQHAAYLMYDTKQYGHFLKRKGADLNLYKIGSAAAKESNIGYNTSPNSNVEWFIRLCTLDNTAKNIPRLGHRRWNINPNMKYTGIGIARPYFVQYAFDMSRSPKVSPDFVAYPSKGAFPLELIGGAPWSIELGRTYSGGGKKYKLNPNKTPKLTLTRLSDNKEETFYRKSDKYVGGKYFNVNTEGYGYGNAIIFKPTIEINALERFKVRIENILDVNTNKPTILEYEVIFF